MNATPNMTHSYVVPSASFSSLHRDDLGRPEAALVGVQYFTWNQGKFDARPYTVTGAQLAPWLFTGTGLANGTASPSSEPKPTAGRRLSSITERRRDDPAHLQRTPFRRDDLLRDTLRARASQPARSHSPAPMHDARSSPSCSQNSGTSSPAIHRKSATHPRTPAPAPTSLRSDNTMVVAFRDGRNLTRSTRGFAARVTLAHRGVGVCIEAKRGCLRRSMLTAQPPRSADRSGLDVSRCMGR